MANFSPVPEGNLLEMKVVITGRRFQPGMKILAWFAKPG